VCPWNTYASLSLILEMLTKKMALENPIYDEQTGLSGKKGKSSWENEVKIVLFSLDDIVFGVNVSQVQSVVDVVTITKVPNAPSFIRGVTNLRSDVIPVIDLKRKFNYETTYSETNLKMMVINNGENVNGILVDSVLEVVNLNLDEMEDIPEIVSSVETTYVKGVVKYKEKLVILLDFSNIV
jgi:purine-binding chemotaxis protein CheW